MRKTSVLHAEDRECQSPNHTSTVKTEVHVKEEPMESSSADGFSFPALPPLSDEY